MRHLFFMGLLLLPLTSHAQHDMLLQAGRTHFAWRSPGLDHFVHTFNTVHADELAQSWSRFRGGTGYHLDAGYRYWLGAGLSLSATSGWHVAEENAQARFTDGSARDLRLHVRDIVFTSEAEWQGSLLLLGAVFETRSRRVALTSASRTPSGRNHHDGELDGTYEGGFLMANAGLKAGIGFYPVLLVGRWTWPVLAAAAEPLFDGDEAKLGTGRAYFPQDYRAYRADPQRARFRPVHESFYGATFTLSLVLSLPA